MSTGIEPVLYLGMQETFRNVITEGEATTYACLVGENIAHKVEVPSELQGDDKKYQVKHLLMAGIVGGLLDTSIPGPGSECVNIQFEFLAPIFIGDIIETTIELVDLNAIKHLATFKMDCFNQNKNQVITGRAVMFVKV